MGNNHVGPNKDKIGYEIKTLSNLIKRRIDNSAVFSEEVTGMHGWIIRYLYHSRDKRDIFQRDIETEFSIRRSTVTGILQLMEKNNLIRREPVGYDARLKKLVLTQKAIEIYEAIQKELDNLERQLAKDLTKEELTVFFSVMRKMRKNLE